jgi:peroxiredoxin
VDSIAQIGSPAPDFELKDLEGDKHALRDELGSILVLNFWSAECIHSKRADEIFEEFAQKWGDSVSSWCIASNENEDDELIKNVAGTNKIKRLLRDRHQSVADAYGAVTTPHLFVIDAMGVLRYAGAFDDVSLRQRTPTRNYLQEAVVAVQNGLDPEPSETSPFGCAIIRHAI